MLLCSTRPYPPFLIKLGNVELWERGLQHLEFTACIFNCVSKQRRVFFLLLLATAAYDLNKCPRMSCIDKSLCIFFLPARTKLLRREQRGLHSPLFSDADRPLLQVSRQRSGRGLRGARQWVLKRGG